MSTLSREECKPRADERSLHKTTVKRTQVLSGETLRIKTPSKRLFPPGFQHPHSRPGVGELLERATEKTSGALQATGSLSQVLKSAYPARAAKGNGVKDE